MKNLLKKLQKKFNALIFSLLLANSSVCYAAGLNTSSHVIKFFGAMLGVAISSFAIFFGLKLYKKITLKNTSKSDNINYDKNLETPKNFKDAINLFLDKTDK